MGLERNSYRFSGGTSFMSNGYVIWKQGLDGDEPNWLAKQQGNAYIQRMFYDRSLDQRASFFKFTEYLQQIEQKEANKERKLIELKLQQMNLLKVDPQRYNAVQRAIYNNQFGLAYTLLLDFDTSIDELKEELKSSHFNNISHMNKFWKKQFSDYLHKVLEQRSEIQGERLVKKMGDSTLSIDDLVDGWMKEMLVGSNGAIADSLEPIRESMKKELLGYLQNKGISGLTGYADDIFGIDSNFTQLSGFKTTRKKGGHRDVKALTRLIADAVGNAVGKGLSQELAVTAEQGKRGISFNTGTFYKDIIKNLENGDTGKVYQKSDVISFEAFSASYDINQLAESFFEKEGFSQESFNKFKQQLETLAKQDSSTVFEVSTNVKGYRSKRDLQIEGIGSFRRRTQNILKMAQEAEGIPAYSMEKLIFMLNNTVDGCIAENQIDNIVNYFAAVCVAWMWDDYTDLMSVSESDTGIQKVRMFNSGGIYYSASQIIGQTLTELLNKYKGSSFVNVEIQPPSFDADGMYRELKNKYPVPASTDKKEWQSALAPRWNEMRDYVANNGKISIKFNQAGLENLIGKLSQYL